ncbi:TPA: hypothetical protein N0F65_004923 [Lagenidium giganteum]|uniref:Uncharacterized protein n=1 Tax=Lagenidium giganteum TaxID=4803 RepID=A0AAV2YY21_9STRA|nr:TPA: hypothetical protein N0F65_004923 [Lagenidium giganteum]
MARKVWFHLVDAATRGAFLHHKVSSVSSDGVDDIEDLRNKIHAKYDHTRPQGTDILAHLTADQLDVYANRPVYDDKDGQPLKASASVDDLGKDEDRALIVVVPTQHLAPRTVAPEPEKYAEECTSLTEWAVNAVHEIPLIWKFMSSLGGCTSNAKIFWRLEDKQVASILVDGWFRESTDGNINARANKKSILMGSPGIGKSTLLCVMAFYLVFKHKKNVLLYRRLTKRKQENCLLYLGYKDGEVVQFSVLTCEESKRIYKLLRGQHSVSNVWLLLDGFLYQDIPEGIRTFDLLATSQQVDLKAIYHFEEEGMEERFYYSGGSVREFAQATAEDIRIAILNTVRKINDAAAHLPSKSNVQSGPDHLDCLRRTFVKDVEAANALVSCEHWEQVVIRVLQFLF